MILTMTVTCTGTGTNFCSGPPRSIFMASSMERTDSALAFFGTVEQVWDDAFQFAYDMSVPNVARLRTAAW